MSNRLNFLFTTNPYTYRRRQLLTIPRPCVYDTVLDIPSYETFLPWCKKSSWVDCVDLKQLSNHGGQRKATITVDFKLIKESYTSVVHFNPHDRIKAVAANNDLFEVLDTVWEFKDIGDATEVDFNIKFKFHSGMYQTITTYMGRTLSGSMVDHFVKECYRRHNLKKIPFQKEHVGI